MRVVSDAKGVRRIEVDCPGCGYSWQSDSRSGRTTCPECGGRVYIPVALRREAYEPPPVIRYDGPEPPGGFFGRGRSSRPDTPPMPQFPVGRTLTAQERRDLGFAPEPEPPARPPSRTPRAAQRSSKRSAPPSGGGWLVGLAAGAFAAAEVARALRRRRTQSPRTQPVSRTARAPSGACPPVGTSAPSQYAPRPQPARQMPSRSGSSIAKLSCQHTVRLRGRPSEVLGWAYVKCPQCGVNVTVLDAEPARSPR